MPAIVRTRNPCTTFASEELASQDEEQYSELAFARSFTMYSVAYSASTLASVFDPSTRLVLCLEWWNVLSLERQPVLRRLQNTRRSHWSSRRYLPPNHSSYQSAQPRRASIRPFDIEALDTKKTTVGSDLNPPRRCLALLAVGKGFGTISTPSKRFFG